MKLLHTVVDVVLIVLGVYLVFGLMGVFTFMDWSVLDLTTWSEVSRLLLTVPISLALGWYFGSKVWGK